jgi:hypothetical protein
VAACASSGELFHFVTVGRLMFTDGVHTDRM